MTTTLLAPKDNFLTHKDGKLVMPIHWETQEFTNENRHILDYAKELLSKNTPRGVHLTQDEVDWFFEGNVKSVYPHQHPRRIWLIQQMRCPLIMTFWEDRLSPSKALLRRSSTEPTSFRPVPPNRHRIGENICSVVLTDGREEIEVLDIKILGLHQVDYVATTRLLHEVNGQHGLGEWKMRRIWRGIVINVFHFECECKRAEKLREAESEEARRYWRGLDKDALALRGGVPVGSGDFGAGHGRAGGIGYREVGVQGNRSVITHQGMEGWYPDRSKGEAFGSPLAARLGLRFKGMERMLGM